MCRARGGHRKSFAPFISTNDCLVSAFANALRPTMCMMAANFRGKATGLDADDAGNYEDWVYDYDPPPPIDKGLTKDLNSSIGSTPDPIEWIEDRRRAIDDEVTRGTKTSWCAHDVAAGPPPVVSCGGDCPPGFGNSPNCDAPLPSSYCPNQCDGHGKCEAGFCICEPGRWGADCSLESASPVATRRRSKPLVYVHASPPEYTSNLVSLF